MWSSRISEFVKCFPEIQIHYHPSIPLISRTDYSVIKRGMIKRIESSFIHPINFDCIQQSLFPSAIPWEWMSSTKESLSLSVLEKHFVSETGQRSWLGQSESLHSVSAEETAKSMHANLVSCQFSVLPFLNKPLKIT